MVLKRLFGKKDDEQKQVPGTPEPTSLATAQESEQASGDSEPNAALYLEQAMLENARNDNQDTRHRVYQELLFSELLLSLAEPDENAPADQPKDGNLSVAILTNSTGVRFAAAFTSPQAARRWRPDGGNYVTIKGQDIYKLLEPSPAEVIVINAGSAPFVVLPKIEYRQLALGIVPQTGRSPVQIATGAPEEGQNPQDGQMQLAFPPDVFNEEQKAHATALLLNNANIEAAVLGAILPPGGDQQTGWVRTMFLRVVGLEDNAESMQQFCVEVRNQIVAKEELFKELNFEVGVMPDPGFWAHMHQNNIVMFDKNPPPALPQEEREGVLNAEV